MGRYCKHYPTQAVETHRGSTTITTILFIGQSGDDEPKEVTYRLAVLQLIIGQLNIERALDIFHQLNVVQIAR